MRNLLEQREAALQNKVASNVADVKMFLKNNNKRGSAFVPPSLK
jgi:hypothetical protein